MKNAATEEIRQQWLYAADAMPQLICLMDRNGRIIHANRTLERWGLGKVGEIRGEYLHDALHKCCSDPDCYLLLLKQSTAVALARDGRANSDVWDPVLQKHFKIRVQLPVLAPGPDTGNFFAAVTIDDVTELKADLEQARQAAQVLNQRVEQEEQKRTRAEKVQSHLLSVLDKAPLFTAIADRSGALCYLNPAGRTLLGLGEDEALTGLTLIGCHEPRARVRIAKEALPAAERTGVWSGDSVLYSRDGREIKSYLTLIAHRDECGRTESYSLLGRDMSDWVRTEEALRLTQNELWRLSAQHLTIQESERRRIAVDLHDGLGQTLSLVKLSVEEAARSAREGVLEKTAAALERLKPTVKSALTDLRRMAMNLRPATLDDLGIVATLAWYFREFEATCPDIRLERDVSVKESDVPDLLKIAIFRIVQEATGNVLKHAGADRIMVSLSNERDTLELLIEDTGRGFDLAKVADQRNFEHGLGLQSMKERAELSGASYEIRSAPGEGTSICVRWPSLEAFGRDLAVMPQPLVDSVRKLTPADHQMPDRFTACVACMRAFGRQP